MTNRACPDGFDPTAAVLAVVASIPCGRVVNCAGRTAPGWPAQTALLAAEGVGFKPNGCVDLARFLWDGVEKRI